ncbi:AraC family transcriptional regulator [Clostridium arbusti]|uniref:AraC family transcriptional regulator n=1 Tax=Clostridium arbusti TaxID=1137848 RepID=UPI0002897CCB|nr:AraC family transcriptional regulator [Clostridium arbusti]
MNKNDLYFHIHYCNHRENYEDWKKKSKFTRKIKHHELFLVTGGKGNITVGNTRYSARNGMLFYFKPDLLHSVEADLSDPIKFLSVHFSFVHVNFYDNKWSLTTEGGAFKFNDMQEFKDYYPIFNTFKKLIDTWNIKLPSYEFLSKTILQQLIFEINDNLKRQRENYAITLKVEKIIKYMHENISSAVTLTELSEIISLSPTYLSRIFKDTTGYSVIEFFNKMKIDKAKELMSEGDRKVKEIAETIGFKDEFYFSRLFKKIEGVSPREFYNKNVHEN